LFTSRRKISQPTAEAIAEAERRGVSVVITTGRPLFDAKIRGRLLHDAGQVIASNGASVGNIEDGAALYTKPFSEDELSFLQELVRRNKISATWFSSYAVFTQGFRVSQLYRVIKRSEKNVMSGQTFSVKEMKNEDIQKCNLFFLDTNTERIVFSEINKDGKFELLFTSHRCAEITVKGVSKASGIAFLAGTMNIRQDEIIAVGDSENDFTMIRYAGLGVAMGNAIPALKNEADFVTTSNNHDGIALVIKQFILNN
jgi:hypothetical protein